MDYDRHDALLHWLFKQTQGDAWFRPNEQAISSAVALRISPLDAPPPAEYRVFPYENPTLLAFEQAVTALGPVVAVKTRSAAVHAALASVPPEDTSIYIDANTRIQILDSVLALPAADKEQCAAFIRDERVLIIWSDAIDRIVPTCSDFEDRLIKLLWRSHPLSTSSSSRPTSSQSHTPSSVGHSPLLPSSRNSVDADSDSIDASNPRPPAPKAHSPRIPTPLSTQAFYNQPKPKPKIRRTWLGRLVSSPPGDPEQLQAKDVEQPDDEKDSDQSSYDPRRDVRAPQLWAPLYNGLAGGLALLFIGNGIKILLQEWILDGGLVRMALLAVCPLLYCVALFFALQIIQNVSMVIGPIEQYHSNSKYYSAIKPPPNTGSGSETLPHITIQMPVYKEGLHRVLAPSILSLKRAMQTYARQGGSSAVFVCDDGMRVLPEQVRRERLAFYAVHGIAWVARPGEGEGEGEGEVEGGEGEGDVEKGLLVGGKGYVRKGRFKKASNLNYGLDLSLKLEKHLARLIAYRDQQQQQCAAAATADTTPNSSGSRSGSEETHDSSRSRSRHQQPVPDVLREDNTAKPQPPLPVPDPTPIIDPIPAPVPDLSLLGAPGLGFGFAGLGVGPTPTSPPGTEAAGVGASTTGAPVATGAVGTTTIATATRTTTPTRTPTPTPAPAPAPAPNASASLEDQALALAIAEIRAEAGGKHRPWAAGGRAARMGEIVLLVDADTVVPEDCLRDAAREMQACPKVAIVQHESDVMQVAHHYFENGIAYFTRRINRSISMACANGEVAPFVGHNAFLRWRALQDAAFVDPQDGKEKIWSESNVSEDFDMALRLMARGYIIRWATYSRGGFKEGVSLSVDDELNRWQKYAYGCSELLFNPFSQWFRRGPIAPQIHRFMWSGAPVHYKISMMAYMFSYYGIAGSCTISIINYVLLGFQFGVDGFYMHSFEIWLATTVVFFGSGTLGYSVLQYRLGQKQLVPAFLENLMWIPFFFFFFGGLSIPVSQAILAHMFSYNISWSATIKEVQRSNFFKEIPKIARRFWFPMTLSVVLIFGMIVCSTQLVPLEWRVDGAGGWAVIFPVAVLAGCHILFPIVLNPWLMVFSY